MDHDAQADPEVNSDDQQNDAPAQEQDVVVEATPEAHEESEAEAPAEEGDDMAVPEENVAQEVAQHVTDEPKKGFFARLFGG